MSTTIRSASNKKKKEGRRSEERTAFLIKFQKTKVIRIPAAAGKSTFLRRYDDGSLLLLLPKK